MLESHSEEEIKQISEIDEERELGGKGGGVGDGHGESGLGRVRGKEAWEIKENQWASISVTTQRPGRIQSNPS